MRPMVAAVAADDPDTAAKMPQPMTLVCIRPPGSRFSHGDRPPYMSSDRRERNRIAPIQMNSGNGASAQDDTEPQAEVPSTRPVGALVKTTMANRPTPNNDSATQMPLPSMKNSTSSTSRPISTTLTGFPPHCRPVHRPGRPAHAPETAPQPGYPAAQWQKCPGRWSSPLAGSTTGSPATPAKHHRSESSPPPDPPASAWHTR